MKIQKVNGLLPKLSKAVQKNSPTILTALSVAGLVTTVVLAVKATPKALEILEEEKNCKENGELTTKEVVAATWKCYVPTAIMGTATVACMIGSTKISLRRNAALASVYSIAETTLKEYQAKVIETIGENKEKKIREEIAQDRVNKTPNNSVFITGSGDSLCLDLSSGRYFKTSVDKLRKVENELGSTMLNDMWISLNEVYMELGLEPITVGYDIGWDINRDGLVKFNLNACLSEDETPCITLDFVTDPKPKVY